MPAVITPLTAASWKDLPQLSMDVSGPAWEDTLRKVQSALLIAVKEFHFQEAGGDAQNFPDRIEPGHAFWPWFAGHGGARLYRMIDELPENYDRSLAERIVNAAQHAGIALGSRAS